MNTIEQRVLNCANILWAGQTLYSNPTSSCSILRKSVHAWSLHIGKWSICGKTNWCADGKLSDGKKAEKLRTTRPLLIIHALVDGRGNWVK